MHLLEADTAGPDDALAADGYIFAAPENLALFRDSCRISSIAVIIRFLGGSADGPTAP